MTEQPSTIRITKAAIRRRKLAQRVQGDLAYHAYGLTMQACVVLMLSGIVFSLVGLRFGRAGNAAFALAAMVAIGFAGARGMFAATHRDYGGVLIAGAIVTGFLGVLVGVHVAAGRAEVGLGAQLAQDALAVFFGTLGALGGALLGRHLQSGSLLSLVAEAFARRGKGIASMDVAQSQPAPSPAPRADASEPIVAQRVAFDGASEGDICPICTDDENRIRPGDMCITCPQCSARHHPECWEQNGGCGTLHQS